MKIQPDTSVVQKITRYIEHTIFDSAKEQIAQLYNIVKGYIDKNGDSIWNMQFRKDNEIFLYYCPKGVGRIIIKFSYDSPRKKGSLNFKVSLSEKLQQKAINDGINILNQYYNIDQLPKVIGENLEKIERFFSNVIKRTVEERKHQFIMSSKLENEKKAFIIDLEVVKSGDRGKGSEGDAIALVKNFDGFYKMLPIEFKMASQGEGTALQQVKKLAEKVNNSQDNYKILYKQKQLIGMFKASADIEFLQEINECLIVILYKDEDIKLSNSTKIFEDYKVHTIHVTPDEFVNLDWIEDLVK